MSFSAAPTAADFKQAVKERDEPSDDPSFWVVPYFESLRGSFLLRERQHEIKPGHYPVLNGVEIVTKLVQNLIWAPLFARG
jgi:hypothetical protein